MLHQLAAPVYALQGAYGQAMVLSVFQLEIGLDLPSFKEMLSHITEHDLFFKCVMAVVACLCIWMLGRLIEAGVARKIDDKDIRFKLRKGTTVLSYLVMLIVVMTIFSEQMTNLAVIIGALSVGIGFAMREVIQSFFGWMAIYVWGMYKVGQRIQLGGVIGDVIDIGPLTTTVMECGVWVKADLYTGRVVSFSNSLVFKENIINYTSNFPFLWDEIVIPVRTDSDHKAARELILWVAKRELVPMVEASASEWKQFIHHNLVEEASVEPMVSMSFDENWIEFTLRYVVDHRRRRSTKDRLFTRILEAIEQTEGRVKVANNSLRLSDLPAFNFVPPKDLGS